MRKKKKLVFVCVPDNVIAELFGRFGSFIFGWLVPLSLVEALVAVLGR